MSMRAAHGDMLPSRNNQRRIIDDLMDRCCSQINDLHGCRSAYFAGMRSDAGCYIGRAATKCSALIVVMPLSDTLGRLQK